MKNRPICREDIRTYVKAGVIATKESNAIAFDNQGDVTAIINKTWKVRPGQVKSISYIDPAIIIETDYRVDFDLTDAFTTGTDNNLCVICSFIQLPNPKNNFNGPDTCK